MDELERQAAPNLGTEQLRGLIDFARDVLKSVTLINGGAAVALLAFARNVLSGPETNSTLDPALIYGALLAFIIGIFFSGVAIMFGYITQYNYFQVSINNLPEGKNKWWHISALVFTGASFLSFLVGVILSFWHLLTIE